MPGTIPNAFHGFTGVLSFHERLCAEAGSVLFSPVFLMPRPVPAMQKALHVYPSKGYS